MKIVLIGPRTVNGNLDGIVWNFQLPLQSLGHKVFLFDVIKGDNDSRLQKLIDKEKPDLLFSILVAGFKKPHFEPIDTIKKYTDLGTIKTFNWFADDVWRFSNFSIKECRNFFCCSTTEPRYVEKYKESGYENIILANWHANEDLYSDHRDDKYLEFDISFIGNLYPARKEYVQYLVDNGVNVNVCSNLSFEQMIYTMSNSLISLNFSSNPNAQDNATQMKGRLFEILGTGSLLLTEYHESIEEFVEENREAVFFKTKEELLSKVKKLLDQPEVALRLAKSGFERFQKEHSSHVRLQHLLETIEKL